MSKRNEIFISIKSELQKIPNVRIETHLQKIEDTEKFPWIGLHSLTERKSFAASAGPAGRQSILEILALVYVRAEEPISALNSVIDAVEANIEDDPTLGKEYPVFARVAEISLLATSSEIAESAGGFYGIAEILIEVNYRYER